MRVRRWQPTGSGRSSRTGDFQQRSARVRQAYSSGASRRIRPSGSSDPRPAQSVSARARPYTASIRRLSRRASDAWTHGGERPCHRSVHPSRRRSSRCSRSSPTSCPRATRSSTSRSGTASARSCFAAATTSTSRAAICGRSIATFPSCTTRCSSALPAGCVVDGEIVIATPRGLDFDALQLRLHPAASRVAKLAKETPASFVAFDLLAVDGEDLRDAPQARAARAARDGCSRSVEPPDPSHADDARSRASPREWLARFEGAGLDGVIAKPERRRLRARQARDDQDQARAHRRLRGRRLPLAQEREGHARRLAAARALRRRRRAASRRRDVVVHDGEAQASSRRSWRRCASDALDEHPWREWAEVGAARSTRMPGGQSRWSAGKDLSWEPLRIERVCEVKYDHMQGDRFRHARDLPALAARQAAARLPLRSARGHDALRAREGLRRTVAASADARPVVGTLVRVERLLRRPQLVRHVLQIDADARPRLEASAHRVDEHVGRLRGARPRRDAAPSSARAPRAHRPSRSCARDLDQRLLRRAARVTAARAAARPAASGSAAATAHRPGLRAPAAPTSSSSASSEHGVPSIAGVRIADARESRRHRGEREVRRIARVDLVPRRAAPRRARRASAAPSRPRRSCDPSRSGCSRGTRRGVLPSTTCWWRAPARVARPRARAPARRGAPRSNVQRCSMRT